MENFSPEYLGQWAGPPDVEMCTGIWAASKALGSVGGVEFGDPGQGPDTCS